MTSRGARILVVEDEADLGRTVRDNLAAAGHDVEWVREGPAALERAAAGQLDLIVLDVMLPGMDGFEVCRRLRDRGQQVPVLFLTARSEPEDRIRGLEEGGDDYLPKPFRLRELLLRVGAILRRSDWYAPGGDEGARVRFGDSRVDLSTYRGVDGRGRRHELTHKEAMILELLAEREGEVVSRDEILDRVWGRGAYPSSRTVDNFILRLRRRFEPDPASPRHFHTVHGVGYRFTRSPERGSG
ncbi:MAG: response regulator transcription factor [Acidobacteriota bacterium]